MRYGEKLGYIVLGAILMLVGMLTAGLFSPLGAQNEVVDLNVGEITCTGLKVVDERGNAGIILGSRAGRGMISVLDKGEVGRVEISASQRYGGRVDVYGIEETIFVGQDDGILVRRTSPDHSSRVSIRSDLVSGLLISDDVGTTKVLGGRLELRDDDAIGAAVVEATEMARLKVGTQGQNDTHWWGILGK